MEMWKREEKKGEGEAPLIYRSTINLMTIYAFYNLWRAIPSSSLYFSTLLKLFLYTIVLKSVTSSNSFVVSTFEELMIDGISIYVIHLVLENVILDFYFLT
jgi:hypothetical protein